MKKIFAIPIENGLLCTHFGHCEKFAVIETEDQRQVKEDYLIPPEHQPGVYPQFLAQRGVTVIIAGGMGQKAQQLFAQHHIDVCMGVTAEPPSKLVELYLNGQLQTGTNLCDH
jgi:predicted Fe-Mo cluster-binding NifX family protein